MTKRTPRPDECDESDDASDPGGRGPEWSVEGSAGRGTIAPEEVDRAARAYWEGEADTYQAEHGPFLTGGNRPVVDSGQSMDGIDYQEPDGASRGFVWGPEGVTEEELGLLGPIEGLRGRRVLEVGCGAAQCSAWLADRGVNAVGIDIALNQLRHVARSTPPAGGPNGQDSDHPVARFLTTARKAGNTSATEAAGSLEVVAATATALPFAAGTFDGAFASYGAVQFVSDLPRLLGEVRRGLRPGGFWVFSVTHPVRWAFPDDPGPAGLTATGSYFDRAPYVERDADGAAAYAEFHRTLGDYVNAVVAAGFAIERMVEPQWPDWNSATWGGWSPLRGKQLPGTLVIGCRAGCW